MTTKNMFACVSLGVPLLAGNLLASVSTKVTVYNQTSDSVGATSASQTGQSAWSVGAQPGVPRVINVTSPNANPQSVTIWIEDEKTHLEATCIGVVNPSQPESVYLKQNGNGFSCTVSNEGQVLRRANVFFKNHSSQPLAAIIQVVQDRNVRMASATSTIAPGIQTSEETMLGSTDLYTTSVLLIHAGQTVGSCTVTGLHPGAISAVATNSLGNYQCKITQID